MTFETARRRSRILREVRSFFDEEGYLEVETPLLSPDLIPEANIVDFVTKFASPFHPGFPLHLVPSPEIWMKKLIAAGSGSLFQISKCFRNAEQIGRVHNPEFTMLEWYGMGLGYEDQIALTERLFARLIALASAMREREAQAGETALASAASLRPPFLRMSMEEAWQSYAGLDLAALQERGALAAAADRLGLLPGSGAEPNESWESLFNRIFLARVEPALPQERPLVLYDYPALIPSLARRRHGTPWCERWELYAGGIEIANCYSEERDPEAIVRFYGEEGDRMAVAGRQVRTDPRFAALFGPDYPVCAGVALGIDRLVMLLCGIEEIGGVIFFPISDIVELYSKQ